MEVFAEVFYFITLALFCALSGNHNFIILMFQAHLTHIRNTEDW